MKKLMLCKGMALTLSLIISLPFLTQAQVAINVDGSTANNAAMLDVSSTSKGILIPRMTKAQRDLIGSPVAGLMIYQTDDTPGFYFHDGSGWKLIGSGAFSINDLSDGKTGGYSVFLGLGAGVNDDGSSNYNVGFGTEALYANTIGAYNTANGYRALFSNISGNYNTAIGYNAMIANIFGYENVAVGYYALQSITGGYRNTAIGYASLNFTTTGKYNVAVGHNSLTYNSSGENNIGIGYGALEYNKTGSNNTAVGFMAGFGTYNYSVSGNVFLGYKAGYHETSNNKLYIENSDATAPLIYGEFDSKLVRINGDLDVTGSLSGTLDINELSDAKTGGFSIFLGAGSGVNDDGTDNQNVAVGYDALSTNTTGNSNVATGSYALNSNLDGNSNTAIGNASLYNNTSGTGNTAMGSGALYHTSTGNYNTVIGVEADFNNQSGSWNTIIGYQAGRGNTAHNKYGNIFIGYQAGYSESGFNKLYIENSNSTSPLIYGEFDNNFISIYGNIGIGTKLFGGGTSTWSLINGTVPNSSITDGVLLYTEDVSSSSELKVRDEAGNVTTLSPHNFSMTNKSEPMAWSYYSENHAVGEKINVDMLRAIRLLEEMTGEKLVVIEKIDGQNVESSLVEQSLGIIQQQQKLIDELLQRVEKLEKAQ